MEQVMLLVVEALSLRCPLGGVHQVHGDAVACRAESAQYGAAFSSGPVGQRLV